TDNGDRDLVIPFTPRLSDGPSCRGLLLLPPLACCPFRSAHCGPFSLPHPLAANPWQSNHRSTTTFSGVPVTTRPSPESLCLSQSPGDRQCRPLLLGRPHRNIRSRSR